jgi:hypothetical protein
VPDVVAVQEIAVDAAFMEQVIDQVGDRALARARGP